MVPLTLPRLGVLILAIALGLLRLAGVKTIVFQAMAHVFVGMLLGLSCKSKFYMWTAIALSALELGVAVCTRL